MGWASVSGFLSRPDRIRIYFFFSGLCFGYSRLGHSGTIFRVNSVENPTRPRRPLQNFDLLLFSAFSDSRLLYFLFSCYIYNLFLLRCISVECRFRRGSCQIYLTLCIVALSFIPEAFFYLALSPSPSLTPH